jgi:hypothetical protein
MDTELFKMLLTVINQVVDKLPVGITGIIVTVLIGYAIHRSKKVPYKIVRVGTNGSTTVTANMLKANCQEYHLPLNETLSLQKEALNTLIKNQSKISEEVVEIGKQVSFISGRVSR